jgi:hypothetical protein
VTREIEDDIAVKVLQLIYASWFKDFYEGLAIEDVIANTKNDISTATDNQIKQVVGSLQTNGLVIEDDIPRYKITASGIDIYEESLPLDIHAVKRRERTRILQVLEELYQTDTNGLIHSEILRQKLEGEQGTQPIDLFYLRIVVEYLKEKGFVELKPSFGTSFHIRLTPKGFEALKDSINDNLILMTRAYQLLFRLENHMRKYIEAKLIDYYHNDWWENGVSQSIREKVDDNKKNEIKAIFHISEIYSDMDYMYFEYLKGLITKNWTQIFKAIFLDLDKTKYMLDTLVDIRNAIAHTRTLTDDGMKRLNQNYDDLRNMMR